MKVYLLYLDDGRHVFYSEGPETPDAGESAAAAGGGQGLRAWAERKYQSLQTTLGRAESGVGLHMRRAWQWLQRRAAPDESMLRSLRNASELQLYHPSMMKEDEARLLWSGYLKERGRGHAFWLVLNALVTPLTVLLAPVPGPNVIGYWFLYRAICHLLAWLGVRRAIRARGLVGFFPSDALDGAFSASDDERLGRVSELFGLKQLDGFVARASEAKRDTRERSRLAVS